MNRTEELDLIGRALDRMLTLITEHNEALPERGWLLDRVNELSEQVNHATREIGEMNAARKIDGIYQLWMLWLAVRSIPGCHVTITREMQEKVSDLYDDTKRMLRVDTDEGDIHLIAFDKATDMDPDAYHLDFTGLTEEVVARGEPEASTIAVTLFRQWADAPVPYVSEGAVRMIVDERFGVGAYDRLREAQAYARPYGQSPAETGLTEAEDKLKSYEDPASDAVEAKASAADVANEALKRIGEVGPDVAPRTDLEDIKRSGPPTPRHTAPPLKDGDVIEERLKHYPPAMPDVVKSDDEASDD